MQGIVVAPPATGKGRGRKLSAPLLPECNPTDGVPVQLRSIGSGEGMAQAYFDWAETGEAGPGGKPEKELCQVRYGVLFFTDEGAVWDKYAQRSGQTTIETIRSMFMAEPIGGTYASQHNRKVWLRELEYRAVIMISVQPGVVGSLLSDWQSGTPQRFLWAPAGDPGRRPGELPDWPGPLDWQPVGIDIQMRFDAPVHPIRVDKRIMAEIDIGLCAGLNYQVGDMYNAHQNLLRLKVAMLLAILDGCLHTGRAVSMQDWKLAGMFVEMSNATRNQVLGLASAEQEQRRAGSIALHADKAMAAELAAQTTRDGVMLVAQRIRRQCQRHPEGVTTQTLRNNTKGPGGRDHKWFAQALARAQAEGWVEQKDDGLWLNLKLLAVERGLWQVIRTVHWATCSRGLVYDDEDLPVVDNAPRIQAYRALVQVYARRARLLGLDAPAVIKFEDENALDAEIEAWLAERDQRSDSLSVPDGYAGTPPA